LGWLWYPGLPPVLVSIAFPFDFHISVLFHPLFFTCHWISFVFLPYGRRICTHSVDSSLTHCLGEFPGLGLALVSMGSLLWSQRRNSGAHGAEISIQISALAGPWHLPAANVTTRQGAPPPFSRLLRHAGGYIRTILTPNLQGLELLELAI